eukprot:scaffold659356_cov84-Prasinocladus_malaysianus.AAC.1
MLWSSSTLSSSMLTKQTIVLVHSTAPSLLASWQELVEVAFSRRYSLLGAPVMSFSRQNEEEEGAMAMVLAGASTMTHSSGSDPGTKPSEVLHEALRACLVALDHVLSTGMERMAPLLCSAAHTLLSRAQ